MVAILSKKQGQEAVKASAPLQPNPRKVWKRSRKYADRISMKLNLFLAVMITMRSVKSIAKNHLK